MFYNRPDMPARELSGLATMAGWKPTEEGPWSVARLPDESLNERNKALSRERCAEDFGFMSRLREGCG